MGHNDLAEFLYSHGNLGEAFKNYVRTRDYCTTSKHIVQMCLNVILVSIELGQFMHVSNYVSKAEQPSEALDPVTVAKLKCAAGLAFLETKKYKLAARKVCLDYTSPLLTGFDRASFYPIDALLNATSVAIHVIRLQDKLMLISRITFLKRTVWLM